MQKDGLRILFALCILTFALRGAQAISDNAGTKNGNFLKLPTDARGVVLSNTMSSMAEGSEALRWNPAALPILDGKEFSATHIQYYQDVHIENIAYATPLNDGSALAGSVFYLSPGSLEGRSDTGEQTGSFSFYDLAGSVGYGRRLRSREEGLELYAGGAFKLVQEKIAETSNMNPAFDGGLLAMPADDLRIGLTLRNLSFGKAKFPKEITGGLSYTVLKALTGAFAVKYADDAPIRYSLASEYKLAEQFQGAVVRVGYQSHDSLEDSTDSQIKWLRAGSLAGLTMGAGMEYRPPQFKTLNFIIDYGMAPFGALGISHTITLKVKW